MSEQIQFRRIVDEARIVSRVGRVRGREIGNDREKKPLGISERRTVFRGDVELDAKRAFRFRR